MPSRLATLLVATLATAIIVVAPASPASANQGVCVGQGRAQTGPLYFPGFPDYPPDPATVGFSWEFITGLCAYVNPPQLSTSVHAGGTLKGWCGHSVGAGTVYGGHDFILVDVGSFFVVAPDVFGPNDHLATGLLNVVPDATAGQSCITGATLFIVTGALVLI